MVASGELLVAADGLRVTANALEDAGARFGEVLRQLDDAATRSERAWTSAGARRFVGDVHHLRAVAARVPRRVVAAAGETHTLSSTARTLGAELAGRERAATDAGQALASATRQLSVIPPDDPGRPSLLDAQRAARQAEQRANLDADRIRRQWASACDAAASPLSGASELLRSDAVAALQPPERPAVAPFAPPGGPFVGPGLPIGPPLPAPGTDRRDPRELADAALAVARPIAHTALAVHGAALLGQRVQALGQAARAYVRRGYERTMRPYRVGGTVAARVATLRWWGMSSAMDASRARTDARIQAQSSRIAEAGRVMREGRGVVRALGRPLLVPAVIGDLGVLFGGSRFEGTHGTVDRTMAGVGLAAVGTLALAGVGVVSAPLIVGAAVVGATAATIWGIGNLVYEHRESIGNAARSVGRTVASAGSRVTSTVADAGSAIAAGAGNVVASVGGFLGFGG